MRRRCWGLKRNKNEQEHKMNSFFTNNPLWIEQAGRIYDFELVRINYPDNTDFDLQGIIKAKR